MSSSASGDEQSEDGELRQSPVHNEDKQKISVISDDEVDRDDGLEIKPPQARVSYQSSKAKKREEYERSHKKAERYKEERSHRERRREKHHSRGEKERHYQREKYYREVYKEYIGEAQYVRERKDDYSRSHHSRKYEEGGEKRDSRYERELEKYRHKRHEDERRLKHRERRRREAAYAEYVSETKQEEAESKWDDVERELSKEEKAELDLRKNKLLEAEREMARLKELSRLEREKRDRSKRKVDDEDFYNKRMKIEEEEEEEEKPKSDSDVEEVRSEQEEERTLSSRSRSRSVSRSPSVRSDGSEYSRDDRSYSGSRSRSRTRSRSRSGSRGSRSSSQEREVLEEKEEAVKQDEEENNEEKKEEGKKEEKQVENPASKIDESLPPYYPAIQGCRSVIEFETLNRIEEGTYGVVFRAKDRRTEEIVALKRLKMEKEKEGFPITSLREINTLLKGQHPNIVTVREIVVGSNMDKIYIVMDYVEHDLKSLMEIMTHKKQKFTAGEVKCLLKQLLMAVAHLHDNWILHRDLKTSNLLLSHKGILKVGDFGLAREYDSPLKAYTPIVVTLWYRAPELLLCTKEYSTPIDMWSVGCIFAELMLMHALFPGKSEVEQINRIFKDLGTPNENIWSGYNQLPAVKKMTFTKYPVSNFRAKFGNCELSELGLGLLLKFLTYDPSKRVSAEDALKSPFFNEVPQPIDPAMFPTWPAKSELGLRRAMAASPKPPSGGDEYKKLGGDGFTLGMGVDLRRGGAGFSLKF